jgi:hypothetical protein
MLLFMALTLIISISFLTIAVLAGYRSGENIQHVTISLAFCINAICSGVLADQIIRRFFLVEIVLVERPNLPLVWGWLAFFVILAILGPEYTSKVVENIKG